MLNSADVTLYTGGHRGTEDYFGQCSEKWGLSEVTYNFEGPCHCKRSRPQNII